MISNNAINIAVELAAIQSMTVSQLSSKYSQVFGEPTRSRNRTYLQKKLSWRIQELATAGLSEKALSRIKELAVFAPARWRLEPEKALQQEQIKRSISKLVHVQAKPGRPVSKDSPSELVSKPERDPRLPPAGSVLQREWRGEVYEVLVGETDFEYRGTRYSALSQVAREIAGTRWNGYAFFRLNPKKGAR